MKNHFDSFNFRFKVILYVGLCLTVALAALTFLFGRMSSGIIAKQTAEITQNALNSMQEELYSIHKGIENSIIKIYDDGAVTTALTQGGAVSLADAKQSAYDLAHTAFEPSQYLVALYIYTYQDDLLSVYRHAQTPKYRYPEDIYADGENSVIRSYVRSDERVPLVTTVWNEYREAWLIRYCMKIYSAGGAALGYVVCDTDPKPIAKTLEKYILSENQAIWLGTQDEPTLIVGKTSDNNDVSLYYTQNRRYGLGAYSSVHKSAANFPVYSLVIYMGVIFLTVILVCVLLFASFGNANRLLLRENEAKLLANDARYNALQAQINPHFLYNTLDAMSGIAAHKEDYEIVAVTRALSNNFRYCLNDSTPFAALSEEILHVKNYLHIMNMRTDDKIKLEINADSNLLNAKIPRLSLQPLVENAILHGLREKRGDRLVTIEVSVGDNLRIIVTDNGRGANAETLNNLLAGGTGADRRTAGAGQDAEAGAPIGLRNINERLKLLYGGEYGLYAESVEGEYFRTILEFPYINDTRGETRGDDVVG